MRAVNSPSESGGPVSRRAQEIFDARRKAVFISTDRLLARLLLVQWVAAVATALWFSPRAWIGERSQIHLHVWVAIVLGSLVSVLPRMLVARRPGEAITRYVVSTSQLLMSSLLIHLMDGRIEAHFHIFGSLAFISFYRDWRVLIPASAVTMLDHLLRGYFWPESIYGVASASEWRWLEHSLWVVFTDIFLFISCQRGRQKEANYAEKQAEMEELNNHVEQIVRERTSQLEAGEKRFRTIIEEMTDDYWETDLQGRLTFFNQQVVKNYRRSPEQLQGLDGRECMDPETSQEVTKVFRRVYETGEPQKGFVYKVRRGDGTEFYTDATISLILDSAGKPSGFRGLSRDVTEQTRARAELERAKEAAEAASRVKSEFLATMSHEIRTPMNGIIGMTWLALEEDLPPKVHEYLKMIQTAADSLLLIINDILDFSSIESGKLLLDAADFRLRGEMESFCGILQPQAEQKHLAFSWQVSPDTPDAIVGDALKLRRILHHLIGNAIKFTSEGEVVVEVKLADCGIRNADCGLIPGDDIPGNPQSQPPESRGNDNPQSAIRNPQSDGIRLHFAIRDTGIGIPVEKQHRIFEVFTQADGSMSRTYGGMGLGLSLANNLVKLMGGRIWLESEPDRGSTFHFTANFDFSREVRNEKDAVSISENSMTQTISGEIPVHDDRPPATAVETTSSPVVEQSPAPIKREGAYILLVEDNLINQKLAVRLLEKKHHRVVIANNGAEAIDILSREHFDLILMDVQMPVMNGLEATIKIREKEKSTGEHIPILAVTANAMQGDRELCLDAGMDDYTTKPIRSEELYRLIDLYSSAATDRSDLTQNAQEKNLRQYPLNSPARENRFNI